MKLKQVRKFKDLVSVLRQNGKYDTAIPRRIGIVKDANQKQSKKKRNRKNRNKEKSTGLFYLISFTAFKAVEELGTEPLIMIVKT